MRLVAVDGADVEPVLIDQILLSPGERFDLELECTQPAGRYWIRSSTLRSNNDPSRVPLGQYLTAFND